MHELTLTKETSPETIKGYFEGILKLAQSEEKFPVNFDDVWQLVYKNRKHAADALAESFFEDDDYIVLQPKKRKQKGRGGHNKKTYKLSSACLEYFIARKVRPVFEVYRKVFHKAVNQDPMQALNDPAAMRGILLTYTEKVLVLEEEVKEQAPKVAGFDRIAKADGLTCITDTAKSLQRRPIDLFNWMSANKWIYRRPGGKGWLAYQPRIQQGVLSHKVTTVQTSDGRERIIESVLVTAKGLTKLSAVFMGVAA